MVLARCARDLRYSKHHDYASAVRWNDVAKSDCKCINKNSSDCLGRRQIRIWSCAFHLNVRSTARAKYSENLYLLSKTIHSVGVYSMVCRLHGVCRLHTFGIQKSLLYCSYARGQGLRNVQNRTYYFLRLFRGVT